MLPSYPLSKIKILPSLVITNDKEDNTFVGNSKEQDKHPNDIHASMIPDIIINVDPYSLIFSIKTSFSLSIDDIYCPYYTIGFNLLHESRTSKLYIALYRFDKCWTVMVRWWWLILHL